MDENINLLNDLILKSKIAITKEYQKFIDNSVREEYSIGLNTGIFGYYSPEHLEDLMIINQSRGKLVNPQKKKFDFKYYFDKNNELILTERHYRDIEDIDIIFFYNYPDRKKIYYFSSFKYLYLVGECTYDELNRLKRYIYTDCIINKKMLNYIEQLYEYTNDEVIIKYNVNVEPSLMLPDGRMVAEEYRYPLSILFNKSTPKNNKLITNKDIYNLLKNKIIEIIQSWNVKNGYAISVLIHGISTISLDYNEENEDNADIHSEKRWNYALWEQHNYKVLKTNKEMELLQNWLNVIDIQFNEDYSINNLIDNDHFTDIIIKIMNEVRNEGLIKKVFGKEVPIIIHNLEYCDHVINLTKRVNDKKLLTDFIQWYQKDSSNVLL